MTFMYIYSLQNRAIYFQFQAIHQKIENEKCMLRNSKFATNTGYQPESEWDRAQSECLMITANNLYDTVVRLVYLSTVYKVDNHLTK